MDLRKWKDWRLNALNENNQETYGDEYTRDKLLTILKYAVPKLKSHSDDLSLTKIIRDMYSSEFFFGGRAGGSETESFMRAIGHLENDLNKFSDTDLEKLYNKLNQYITKYNLYPPTDDLDEQYISINESFYHLNSEAKLGLSLRQIRKHLTEIERQYKRTLESNKTNEAVVESWARAYSTLMQLDERLHGLMKSMYKGKK